MHMHVWTVLQVSNPYIKYYRWRCRGKSSTTVWYGPKYVCHSRGCNSAIMIWIKILFPLCTYPMHIWTVFQVSSTCIKYFRRSCGDENSTTVWCGPKYVCHSRGCNSVIMTWIKIMFPLCTYPMHIWTVFQVSNPCIKYFRRSCGDKSNTKKFDGRTYVWVKLYAPPHFVAGA